MPYIRSAKPIIIFPGFFKLSFFKNIRNIMPTAARTGENEVGFNRLMNILLLSIPVRLNIQDVIVVPILAPIITPTAWLSFIIPELTKPTTITVVADDDCITAVTPAPRSTAFIGLDVSFSSIFSSFPPEAPVNPSPNRSIPYRNIANPPINDNTPNMSIFPPNLCLFNLTSFILYILECNSRI